MRDIETIEAELAQKRAELEKSRAEAGRLMAVQRVLEDSIKALEVELTNARQSGRQFLAYKTGRIRDTPTPGQGMVGWLAWWSGLVYTHWGALSCEQAVNRGVLTMQVDWNPGAGVQANFATLNAAKKLAEQHGFLLVIRPGYIWPENPFDTKTDWPDMPLELVRGHIFQLAAWLKPNQHLVAYVMVGFWGRWAEGNGSTQSNNPSYYLEIVRAVDILFPVEVEKLVRRPDILAAVFGTPVAARARRWAIKNLAFAHKWWDAGTDNQGQFATNPVAGRNWRLALRGGPSALECMGPTGQDFDEARDTWPELEAELKRVRVTGYHLWSPGKDFQRLGGIQWVDKNAGAQLAVSSVDLPLKVSSGKAARVSFAIANTGAGYFYRDLWPSLTLEQGNKQWGAWLEGFDLKAFNPGEETRIEAIWHLPVLAPGFYSVYLGFYPGQEAKMHPNWRRQQLQIINLAPGGDGGNALGLEVEVV